MFAFIVVSDRQLNLNVNEKTEVETDQDYDREKMNLNNSSLCVSSSASLSGAATAAGGSHRSRWQPPQPVAATAAGGRGLSFPGRVITVSLCARPFPRVSSCSSLSAAVTAAGGSHRSRGQPPKRGKGPFFSRVCDHGVSLRTSLSACLLLLLLYSTAATAAGGSHRNGGRGLSFDQAKLISPEQQLIKTTESKSELPTDCIIHGASIVTTRR